AATLGEHVRITQDDDNTITGRAVDVTAHGALVVATGGESTTVVHAGDCQHVRPA
ncbi:biotin--[acetyl-CoA-carboxylase] ligase, partial [Halobacterium salinarum]|nr:biotin--[acetyl-CoA-carboxylase] ligase [Halobacterium salinarum]